MKNRLRLLGAIAIVAITGLSMTGCPMDNDESGGLEGAWTRVRVQHLLYDTLTFSGDTFQLRSGNVNWNGTFVVDGSTLTFIVGVARHETTFSRSGRTLTITGNVPFGSAEFAGNWTRQ